MSDKAWMCWFGIRRLTWLYACLLVIALVLLEWFAEAWLPLALFLFVPPMLLLAPLALLMPLAILFKRWRALGIHLACIGLVVFIFMGFRWQKRPQPSAQSFTVITHNTGQGNREAFIDSFPNEKPDAVMLQDVFYADRKERNFRKIYPEYQSSGAAQFMLLTPHTVESKEAVNEALWQGKPIAARFVIRVGEKKIALYSVHMPTPRRELSRARSPRVILEMLWLSKVPTDGFPSYRAWLDARVVLAKQLRDVFEREPLPYIVGGDFNTPDHGIVYHTIASKNEDAFRAAGSGWGFTFPGSKDGGFAKLLGHWLRLDYLFAGKGWKAVDCKTAEEDSSQHRAVLARFEPIL
jgi:vancomycin resistance protein VanJ